ncbi:MAG TPA: hypothetical protein VHK01_05390, partial [Lacipirellulaceae bacterium]|nr:hypothetical protein [Lacipirellulaceae bacterium]
MNRTTTPRNMLAVFAIVAVATAGSPLATSWGAEITTTWMDATTGNWSSPARWDTGVVPNNNMTDTYEVIINADGSYTATLDLNPTINAFTLDAVGATFFASQRLLTVIGDTALTEGTVQWRGSTWNGAGTITNNTLFIAEGNSTVSSVFSNIDTFRLSSNGTIGESNLTLGPSFTNTGTVVLRNDDAGSGRSVTLAQASGAFQNNAGGTLTTEQGPGLVGNTRNLTIANLQNAAAANVNINTDSNFNAVNGQFNNAGNLNVAGGMRLNFQNGADLTHTGGTISLANGANIQFNHSGGVYTQSGGALVMNGAGFVHGDSGATFTFNGGS